MVRAGFSSDRPNQPERKPMEQIGLIFVGIVLIGLAIHEARDFNKK
jgi:hypothetical protein